MKFFSQTLILVIGLAFSLNAFSSSLGIQKKSSHISNDLFNQIDSDIENSKNRINKQLAETEVETQGFDEVKSVKATVVVPDKPALVVAPIKAQPEDLEESLSEEDVPDVIAEHISDSRKPASADKVYKNASIDDELSSELEELAQ